MIEWKMADHYQKNAKSGRITPTVGGKTRATDAFCKNCGFSALPRSATCHFAGHNGDSIHTYGWCIEYKQANGYENNLQ